MRRIIQIICLSLLLPIAAVCVLPDSSAANQGPAKHEQDCEDRDAQLLSAFNDSVQQRFKDIDGTFGYSRVIRIGQTPHRFKPENAKEVKDVDGLKQHGLKVLLYVAGRVVLSPRPAIGEQALAGVIKGPGFVTADSSAEGLPARSVLWDESRKAMLAFQTTDVYNFTAGKWRFTARVVRASEQSCLSCHASGVGSVFRIEGAVESKPTLRIGDPLGVVLYGYERTR
jgi:hypothetical protein